MVEFPGYARGQCLESAEMLACVTGARRETEGGFVQSAKSGRRARGGGLPHSCVLPLLSSARLISPIPLPLLGSATQATEMWTEMLPRASSASSFTGALLRGPGD